MDFRNSFGVRSDGVIPEMSTQEELAALGLAEEDFEYAARRALTEYRAVSDISTRQMRGTTFWATLVEALRERLLPRGWRMDYCDGYDLVIHPDGNKAIVVTRGDANTGSNSNPKTHGRKGPNTERAVKQNAQQLNMFQEFGMIGVVRVAALPFQVSVLGGMQLWILLFYRNNRVGQVEMELSLPEAVGQARKPSRWAKRIPLVPVPFDDDFEITQTDVGSFDSESIDVDVDRREYGS